MAMVYTTLICNGATVLIIPQKGSSQGLDDLVHNYNISLAFTNNIDGFTSNNLFRKI